MNKKTVSVVIAVILFLTGFSVFLAVKDRQNTISQPELQSPQMFHSATSLQSTETKHRRMLKLESPDFTFHIPEDLVTIGHLPTTSFNLQMAWPGLQALGSRGHGGSVNDVIRVTVRFDPRREARVTTKSLKMDIADGSYLLPIQDEMYPEYLIYPQRSYQKRNELGTAYYQTIRPDATTAEGDPLVFHCSKVKVQDDGYWTSCRGYYRVLSEFLVMIDFHGDHIKDGTDIILKTMAHLRTWAELKL